MWVPSWRGLPNLQDYSRPNAKKQLSTNDSRFYKGRNIMPIQDFRPVLDRTGALAEKAMQNSKDYAAYTKDLNDYLRKEIDEDYYSHWDVQPCPVAMTATERNSLAHLGRMLYQVVERILQMYANGIDDVVGYNRRYTLFRPLMHRQLVTWQEYGRYDFIISSEGRPLFIETNAAMASGYLPGHYVQQRFVETAPDFLGFEGMSGETPDRFETFGEYIRSAVATFDQGDGVLAILVDENHKMHEVAMIKKSCEAAGVKVAVGDVADLEHANGQYRLGGERVKATFNKFRIFGSQHHWSEGAHDRYHVFLEGLQNNAFLSINNFACLTVAEDKGIFASMRTPAVRLAMTSEELDFIDKHTPATYSITPESMTEKGDNVKEMILKDQGQWILKPRNDYRGSGIWSGRDHSSSDWAGMVKEILEGQVPYLAQSRVDPHFFNVAHSGPEGVKLEEVRIVGGVYFRHMGVSSIVARVSPHEVVNAITGAYVLPEIAIPQSAAVPALQPA